MDFSNFYHDVFFDLDNNVRRTIRATQGDVKSRGLHVRVINGGLVIPLVNMSMIFKFYTTTNTTIPVTATKTGDEFHILFPPTMFLNDGIFNATLTVTDSSSGKITDRPFKIVVDSNLELGAILAENRTP